MAGMTSEEIQAMYTYTIFNLTKDVNLNYNSYKKKLRI